MVFEPTKKMKKTQAFASFQAQGPKDSPNDSRPTPISATERWIRVIPWFVSQFPIDPKMGVLKVVSSHPKRVLSNRYSHGIQDDTNTNPRRRYQIYVHYIYIYISSCTLIKSARTDSVWFFLHLYICICSTCMNVCMYACMHACV